MKSGRPAKNYPISVERRELYNLLFWAGYGIEKAVHGSRDKETEALIWKLAKQHRIQISKPKLGKYCK